MVAKVTVWRVLTGVVVLGAAAWVTARAQGLGPSSGGSLTELTNEVRQLRLVIERAAQTQNQMDAVNIQLTAQQSRLGQVSARLDAVNAELSVVQARNREYARQRTLLQGELARTSDARERAALDQQLSGLKSLADASASEETILQGRAAEYMGMFRTEEQRWREISARLDGILRGR